MYKLVRDNFIKKMNNVNMQLSKHQIYLMLI